MNNIELLRIEVRNLSKQIADLRRLINENEFVRDLVNREQALEILGVKSKTLSNYLSDGTIEVASTNAAGIKFFSRKQLLGRAKEKIKRHSKLQFNIHTASFDYKYTR